jgi:hydrogenase large subunit
MATTTIIDPIPRIEGHMKVTLTIDTVGGVQKVVGAQMIGNMYRGFENFMVGQDPLDAPLITQRICGVCPISHAMAAVTAMDVAANVQPTPKGRLINNLIHGAEFLHSHILHSYTLMLQDYIDMPSSTVLGAGTLNVGPWAPLYGASSSRRPSLADTNALCGSYVAALTARRKAHTICAILGGKQPHAASFIGGGNSATPASSDIATMTSLLNDIKAFITASYIPDMNLLFGTSGYYSDYSSIGVGPGKLLSYGVFPQGTDSVNTSLLKRGIYNGTSIVPVMDQNNIVEDVLHAWYTGADNLQPFNGVTNPIITPDASAPPSTPNPFPGKTGAYSWGKAPRYKTNGTTKEVYEVGPLARMVVTGDYPTGKISVADRGLSRPLESLKVANAMLVWLADLSGMLSEPSFISYDIPTNGIAAGLTEAIRGALGHWIKYDNNKKISHYQVITPTCWNASPLDADGQHGPIEQALIGTQVTDAVQPIEAVRVIHSFDPCMACSIHVIRDDGQTISKFIV